MISSTYPSWKNLLFQESGLSKGAILALNSDTLKMERQKLLRAQDPGDTGDTDGFATGEPWIWWVGKPLGLVELNTPWKIAGNWKELAKECLAMRVEPVETWLKLAFFGGGMGVVNSSCLVKLSCDVCFFFPLIFWCTKRAWIPGSFKHLCLGWWHC